MSTLPQGGRKPLPLLRRGLPRGHVPGPLKRTLSRNPPAPRLQELPPNRARVEGHEEAPLQGLQKPGGRPGLLPRQELPQEGAHGRGPAGPGPGGLAVFKIASLTKPLYSPFGPPPEVAVEGGAVQPWAAGRTAWARRRTLKGTTGLVSWGQVDAKGGRHVDGLMHERLATWTRALPVEPHRYHHRGSTSLSPSGVEVGRLRLGEEAQSRTPVKDVEGLDYVRSPRSHTGIP